MNRCYFLASRGRIFCEIVLAKQSSICVVPWDRILMSGGGEVCISVVLAIR